MQDAYDFDDPSWSCPVQQEVTSAAALSRNVKRAEIWKNFVSGLRARDVRAVAKFSYHLDDRVAINSGLSRTEALSGPCQDICEIEFRCGAEANTPFALDHEASIWLFQK